MLLIFGFCEICTGACPANAIPSGPIGRLPIDIGLGVDTAGVPFVVPLLCSVLSELLGGADCLANSTVEKKAVTPIAISARFMNLACVLILFPMVLMVRPNS